MYLSATLAIICWSLMDVLRKFLVEKIPVLRLTFFLTLSQLVFFAVLVTIKGDFTLPEEASYWKPALLAVLTGASGAYLYIKAVSLSPINLTIPYLAFTPVVTVIAGTFIGEKINKLELLAIAMIVLGGFLLHKPEKEKNFFVNYFLALLKDKGSLAMLTVAILWGITLPLDKLAITQSSPITHGLIGSIIASIAFFAILIKQEKPKDTFSHTDKYLGLALIIFPLAMLFSFIAIEFIRTGIFEASKRSIGIITSVIFGKLILKEELPLTRIISICIMSAGVILFVLG